MPDAWLALRTRNGRLKNSFIPGGTLPTHPAGPKSGRVTKGVHTLHNTILSFISFTLLLPDYTCGADILSFTMLMNPPKSFVGGCLATKVFIGKLPATREVWVIIG